MWCGGENVLFFPKLNHHQFSFRSNHHPHLQRHLFLSLSLHLLFSSSQSILEFYFLSSKSSSENFLSSLIIMSIINISIDNDTHVRPCLSKTLISSSLNYSYSSPQLFLNCNKLLTNNCHLQITHQIINSSSAIIFYFYHSGFGGIECRSCSSTSSAV